MRLCIGTLRSVSFGWCDHIGGELSLYLLTLASDFDVFASLFNEGFTAPISSAIIAFLAV